MPSADHTAQRQAAALERIAAALEKIAAGQSVSKFPPMSGPFRVTSVAQGAQPRT